MRTIRFLLRKEFLQIFRDRIMVAQMLIVPLIQLFILANAATFEVKSAPLYVVDTDRSQASRGLVEHLVASRRFELRGASPSMTLASDAMLDRRVSVILDVPADFERDLVRTGAAPVQLVLNAEDGAAAGVTNAYAQRIIADYAAQLGADIQPRLTMRDANGEPVPRVGVPSVDVRTRGWYNPDLDYKDYMVPGILVQLVTVVGTLLTAMNIAREKEIGTLDQLNVTPVTRIQFIAAKLLPLWAIAFIELTLGLIAAKFAFGVPMRGPVAVVFLAAAVYLVAALGMGLWISTLVETQQQAMFLTFFTLMIYLLMAGLFTPLRSMPMWAQWLAQLNPVMHFIAINRAVLLKGAGLADVARPLLILAAYGAVVFGLAVRQYAKRSA